MDAVSWTNWFQLLDLTSSIQDVVSTDGPLRVSIALDRRPELNQSTFFLTRAQEPIAHWLGQTAALLPSKYRGGVVIELVPLCQQLGTTEEYEVWIAPPAAIRAQRRVDEADRRAARAFQMLNQTQATANRILGGIAANIEATASLVEAARPHERRPKTRRRRGPEKTLEALRELFDLPAKQEDDLPRGRRTATLRQQLKSIRVRLSESDSKDPDTLEILHELQDLDGASPEQLVAKKQAYDAFCLRRESATSQPVEPAGRGPTKKKAAGRRTRRRAKASSGDLPPLKAAWRKAAQRMEKLAVEAPESLKGPIARAAAVLAGDFPEDLRDQADVPAMLTRGILSIDDQSAVPGPLQLRAAHCLVQLIEAVPGVVAVIPCPGTLVDGDFAVSSDGQTGKIRRVLQIGWCSRSDGLCAIVEVEDGRPDQPIGSL
ncbi:MAG: hypothetical protein VX899_04165 [Myxococcota bacterium]|nr:hypothetical protein [Myxococcota bacterium]